MKFSACLFGTSVALFSFVLPLNRSVQAQTEITRQVHVVATRDGKFVADLAPADLDVEEGGKKATVVSVTRSTVPLRIALIVSDAGSGEFQLPTARFIQPLLGKAELSMISVMVRPERVLDYTSTPILLDKGIDRVGVRTTLRQDEPHLLSAFLEAVRGIRKEGTRPVIVAMRVGGERADGERPEELLDAFTESGAVIYIVSTGPMNDTGLRGSRSGSGDGRGGGMARLTVAQVIDDGTRFSGGLHLHTQPAGAAQAMQQIADELQRWHLVTYTLPAGANPSDRLKVSTRTSGLKLRAPSRIPK